MPAGPRLIGLGVTGSISAYKSAEVLRLLQKRGCEVQPILTREALHFIGSMTLQALSRRKVLLDQFDLSEESSVAHVRVADLAVMQHVVDVVRPGEQLAEPALQRRVQPPRLRLVLEHLERARVEPDDRVKLVGDRLEVGPRVRRELREDRHVVRAEADVAPQLAQERSRALAVHRLARVQGCHVGHHAHV